LARRAAATGSCPSSDRRRRADGSGLAVVGHRSRPINNRIGAWRSTDDLDRDLAGRWDRLHWLRVGILIAMFVALAIGVIG
jgi:hypothetical protein